MKKLSMVLTFLVIFGSSAIGHTSDECVVFEGTFEKMTRRPVLQFKDFEALDGEAMVRVYNESKDRHLKNITSAMISVNGKKVVRPWDFSKKRFFAFWHPWKKKFSHYSHFTQQDDYIEKKVSLFKGKNSLEVMVNSMRGGKVKVVIAKPKYPGSDDMDCDLISDDGDESGTPCDSPCTGGSTALCDDNCPNDFNPDQADMDGDGLGDVCDTVDGHPDTVTATVGVGTVFGPFGGIAVTPPTDDGEFAYVSNWGDGKVWVINKSIESVIAEISVGDTLYPLPMGIAMKYDGKRAYVCNSNEGTVSVIDTSTNVENNDERITVGGSPVGISMLHNSDHDYAYVSDAFGKVHVIDIESNSVIDSIDVVGSPFGISASPNGTRVYVCDQYGTDVSVIDSSDPSNNSVLDTITVLTPFGISVTPDSKHAYVSSYNSNKVFVIDTDDNSVVGEITVGDGPAGVSVTPNGAYVYVNNYFSGNVSVIDTSTNTVLDTIDVGTGPYGGIGVSSDVRGSVYVGNYDEGTVSVIGYGSE